MTASHVFVLASCVAFTAVILWWMRHAPARLLRLVATRDEAIDDDGEVFDTQPRNAFDVAVDEAILLTHETLDGEEPDEWAADFTRWQIECDDLHKLASKLRERAE